MYFVEIIKKSTEINEFPNNLQLPATPKELYKIDSDFIQTTNVLGMVMFSVILGTCLGIMQDKGKPLLDVFVTLSEAMMIITSWVIW